MLLSNMSVNNFAISGIKIRAKYVNMQAVHTANRRHNDYAELTSQPHAV